MGMISELTGHLRAVRALAAARRRPPRADDAPASRRPIPNDQKITPAATDQKSGLYSGISVVHRRPVPGDRRWPPPGGNGARWILLWSWRRGARPLRSQRSTTRMRTGRFRHSSGSRHSLLPHRAWWETRTTSRRRHCAFRNASFRLRRRTRPPAQRCGSGSTTAGPCGTFTGAGTEALDDARERRMSAWGGLMQ